MLWYSLHIIPHYWETMIVIYQALPEIISSLRLGELQQNLCIKILSEAPLNTLVI